ncbi:hypothetical protein SAMN05192549_105311 [Duganella sacchari]|uniref:Uncharacterized protein n=1 Tax=Duganella sacchari TaxID=551987 RepID=A0A1M7PQU6_9BURK|nr:hypothetical protein [Duganella sacchari]SHN19703.1 hypothetical protein SAMN05192549_105311 [Duganella sacchari]
MRQIPDHVLELIAGGGSSDTSSIPSVTVPGSGGGGGGGWDPGPWDPYPYNPDPGGGGGGGEPPAPAPCHHSSPAPALTPANVNLDALRDKVVQLSNEMKAMGINDVERGALIVRSADGSLHTTPITSGDADGQLNSISYQPVAGEKVVGWVHSHPEVDGRDERLPSNPHNSNNGIGDTAAARALLQNPSVDPGMLMYIVDAKSGQAYEYTAAGSDNRSLGKNVTSDASC